MEIDTERLRYTATSLLLMPPGVPSVRVDLLLDLDKQRFGEFAYVGEESKTCQHTHYKAQAIR